MQVAAGNWKRVAIFIPPRHGKSETASHYGPTWFLGRLPFWRVILASYEASFAASWGRKVRDSLHEAHERGIFTADVRGDVSSVSEWETTAGGGMITAGVGGAITGRGGNLLILDDPIKNAEEAASATYRDKVWEWYTSTFYTRQEPGAAVVLMMTRWHQDDLGGRILALAETTGQGPPWHIINFPGIAEEQDLLGRQPGEALWPERYPVDTLEDRRRTLGSYQFNALYQQRPTAREGGFFKRHWFEIVEAAPAQVSGRVRFWDLAATEGGGDWTRGPRLSLSPEGVIYVEDLQSLQGSPHQVEQLVKLTAAVDGYSVKIRGEQEPGSSGKALAEHYIRLLRGYDVRFAPSSGDKEVRAAPFAAYAEAGNVKLVNGPWIGAFLDELCEFPRGAHDDIVDAASAAFGVLAGKGRTPDIGRLRAARGDGVVGPESTNAVTGLTETMPPTGSSVSRCLPPGWSSAFPGVAQPDTAPNAIEVLYPAFAALRRRRRGG
jgi:predicted phage terminase large subunit-like protein